LYTLNSYGSLVRYAELYDKAIRLSNTTQAKQELGIPEMVKRAMMEDGWICRSTIIWAKPNPMPESVTDRPTKAHEYVFLLTKSQRYYWDQEAVKEGVSDNTHSKGKEYHRMNKTAEPGSGIKQDSSFEAAIWGKVSSRNLRTVWTIATAPYKGAHFATWPPKLVEPMIKAGSSEKGCCPVCGKPWVRVVETSQIDKPKKSGSIKPYADMLGLSSSSGIRTNKMPVNNTTGWRADCNCKVMCHDCGGHYQDEAGNVCDTCEGTCEVTPEPIPCVVLDPFVGSGTTLLVARQLGRSGIGLDLSFTYLKENATKRLELDKLKKWAGR
jgi:hypothetical protein